MLVLSSFDFNALNCSNFFLCVISQNLTYMYTSTCVCITLLMSHCVHFFKRKYFFEEKILHFIDTSFKLTSFLTQVPPLDTGRYGNTINKICLKGHQRGHLQYCPKCWLSTGHWVGQVSQVWYCYKLDINCYQQNLHNYMYLFIGSPDIKLD